MKAAVDGVNKGHDATKYSDLYMCIPEGARNTTAVYFEMDKLVAHATLPDKFAFRVEAPGGGKNI